MGWLEGLFHGIQTTLFAQQMAARAQLEQMRRALPPGMMPQPGAGSRSTSGQARDRTCNDHGPERSGRVPGRPGCGPGYGARP